MNITNNDNDNDNISIYDSHLYFFILLGLSSVLGFLYLKKKRNERHDSYSINNICIINDINDISNISNISDISNISNISNANNNKIFTNLNKNNIEKEESDLPPTYNELFKKI